MSEPRGKSGQPAGTTPRPASAPSRGVGVVIVLVLLVAGWAAFAPGLGGEFLNWDDDRNFVQNPDYRGVGLDQLHWAWSTFRLGVWQPLSWLLLGVQYEIAQRFFGDGLNAAVYRCVSLILHCFNACVFYVLVVAVLRRAANKAPSPVTTSTRLVAGATALLFAVHPLRAEAVCWVSCQPYLPAALFYMLAVLAYLRHRDAGSSPRRWLWSGLVLMCFLLAVLSKAVAVSLPIVLLILDWYPLQRFVGPRAEPSRHRLEPRGTPVPGVGPRVGWALLEKAPLLLVSLAVSVWAAQAKDFNEPRSPLSEFEPNAHLAQSAHALMFYIGKTLWPSGLSAYYRLPDGLSLWSWRYGGAGVAVVGLTVILAGLRRRQPGIFAAWLCYVVILLPNLGLVRISEQLAADRYGYVSLMPLMVLFAAAIYAAWRQWPTRGTAAGMAVAVALALVALAALARQQARAWRDSRSLWSAAVQLDPGCAVSECQLGVAHLMRAEFIEASRHLSASVNLRPDFAYAWSNLGALHLNAGRFDDAVVAYSEALTAQPRLTGADLARTHAGLGAAYLAQRNFKLAWRHAREAERLNPEIASRLIRYLEEIVPREEPAAPR